MPFGGDLQSPVRPSNLIDATQLTSLQHDNTTNVIVQNLADPQGIEPQSSVLETVMLPLHHGSIYTTKSGTGGRIRTDKSFASWANRVTNFHHPGISILVPLVGFEPTSHE